jgi:hypothetical protein
MGYMPFRVVHGLEFRPLPGLEIRGAGGKLSKNASMMFLPPEFGRDVPRETFASDVKATSIRALLPETAVLFTRIPDPQRGFCETTGNPHAPVGDFQKPSIRG